MAQSRLEKIGTIYSRIGGLIQSGALHYNDRPLWYDVYRAFPPAEEPRYDRPASQAPIKEIFYQEDIIRAELHKKIKTLGTVNLQNTKSLSFSQRFIDTYQRLQQEHSSFGDQTEMEKEKLFNETLEVLKTEREANAKEVKLQDVEETEMETFVGAFKLATDVKPKTENLNIKVKDIFKD